MESFPQEEEFKTVDGKLYKKVDSGYTVRQWYSNETEEKGPGPGWSGFVNKMDLIAEKYGIDISGNKFLHFKPSDLPDTPYFVWQPVEEE